MSRKSGRHYHVLVGLTGGYLSDSNYFCATKGEAQETAHQEAERFRDDYWEDKTVKVRGNMRDGYIVYRDGVDWMGIWITECYEEDCWEEE
jgi:hypothetical protein